MVETTQAGHTDETALPAAVGTILMYPMPMHDQNLVQGTHDQVIW